MDALKNIISLVDSANVLAERDFLFDQAPCGYFALNQDGVFTRVNRTLLTWLGYNAREDVEGKLKFSDVISPNELEHLLAKNPSCMTGGLLRDEAFQMIRSDGTAVAVIMKASADGAGLATICLDEEHVLRAQVDDLLRELDSFSYSVSHDLRAPLRSIDGYARILQEDYMNSVDAEGKRVINVILSNATRMSQLMDGLLEYVRLGRRPLTITRTEVEPLVNGIVRELAAREPGRQVEVIVGALPDAFGDVLMLRQLWLNLIENAFKFTAKNAASKVTVSHTVADGQPVYSVCDNGVGFDMEYSNKLYGVFQRLHKPQEFPGNGLGLAIAKRIVARHGGWISAEATLGQGATFHFSLPQQNVT